MSDNEVYTGVHPGTLYYLPKAAEIGVLCCFTFFLKPLNAFNIENQQLKRLLPL